MLKENTVYISILPSDFSMELIVRLQKLSDEYGRLTAGVVSDYINARLCGGRECSFTAEGALSFLKQLKFIEDAFILDDREFSYRDVYERIHFGTCFYGSEYGSRFIRDRDFFAGQGVRFLPFPPGKPRLPDDSADPLMLFLKDIPKDRKLILWGTGRYFDAFMNRYASVRPVSYAVDADPQLQGSARRGVRIKAPEDLEREDPAGCAVVFCAKDFSAMRDRLSAAGAFDFRPMGFYGSSALAEQMQESVRKEAEYLREAHEVNILMMKEVDRVCRKYGIPYYVICGSLIGVIRHGGLIPWDDDVDVAFTREGFEALKKAAKAEWAEGDFTFVDCGGYGNGAFLDFLPRLVYNRKRFPVKIYDRIAGKASLDVDGKLCVDCYIFENAGADPARHRRMVRVMQALYVLCMGHRAKLDLDEYGRLPGMQRLLLRFLTRAGSLIPLRLLIACYEKARRFAARENSEWYFCANLSITCIDRRIRKSFLGEGKDMDMEGLAVRVPSDCGAFLEAMCYHNYMTPPPLHLRKPSHYFNSDISIW